LRGGATTLTALTVADLENISNWDTTLGGTIGTISKGTGIAAGSPSISFVHSGVDKYYYIVVDSARTVTDIRVGAISVIGNWNAAVTVGTYKYYRTKLIQSLPGGNPLTLSYNLTIT
jgi:hypothetical protein